MLQAMLVLSIGALVGLDQWTKQLASTYLRAGSVPLWEGVFHLTYVENRGAAWGLGQGGRWAFVAVTGLVVVALLVLLLCGRLRHKGWMTASCVLIAAGGIGNLIDRVCNGFVVDFLDFRLISFPVFNFADCCVVVGSILLMIAVLFVYKDPFSQPKKEDEDGTENVDRTDGKSEPEN